MAILATIFARSPRSRVAFHRPVPGVLLCAALLAAAAESALPLVSRAQALTPSVYQVKAAFLVNFPKYTDWPAEAFANAGSPVIITVLAETRVADELEKAIRGRTFNGREIILRRLASGEDPGVCHILFIAAAEQHRWPALLVKLKNTSVLTVGESDDFLASGGIINLALQNQKIALQVNLTAAGDARIKISSKLLNLATVVDGKSR